MGGRIRKKQKLPGKLVARLPACHTPHTEICFFDGGEGGEAILCEPNPSLKNLGVQAFALLVFWGPIGSLGCYPPCNMVDRQLVHAGHPAKP